ncbi:DUF6838 family protein [Agathobaculum massiliense]|uniref:phage tail terminator family protein n=1 Tax=Agathobaculum massiliense TaxID=3014267 RepID=UPI0036F3CEAE
MKIKDIRAALTALVREITPRAPVVKTDARKPVPRPSFRIDVLPVGGGAACSGAREREADVDIWYYPKSTDHPRDECDAVADQLLAALDGGFEAGGIWLPLDEDASCDSSQDVLACQFSVSWVETAEETGEYMETLVYNREEETE